MLRNNLFTLLIVSMATPLLISPPSTNAAPLVGDDDDSGSDITAPAGWRREGYDDLYDYLDGYNSYEGTGEDVDDKEEEDRSKADMEKRYDQSTLTLMKLKNKQRQLMDHFQRQLMYRRSSPDSPSPSSKKISISNKEEEGFKGRSPRGNRNHNEEDEKILDILNFLMSSQLRREN